MKSAHCRWACAHPRVDPAIGQMAVLAEVDQTHCTVATKINRVPQL
jgi:hypothetical protein